MTNFETAVTAYKEKCTTESLPFVEPIEEYSKEFNQVIYLQTGMTGYVARYDTRRNRLLA
ncbi:MAG: hypothetical protein AAFX01_06305 [Cyanobacteria bacterium J06638_28]